MRQSNHRFGRWPILRNRLYRCDYVFQSNYLRNYRRGDEGNTGFHVFSAAPRAVAFFSEVVDAALTSTVETDEQAQFWNALKVKESYDLIFSNHSGVPADLAPRPVAATHVKLCPLSPTLFPGGSLNERATAKYLAKRGAFVFHANWIKGRAGKRDRLASFGLWVVPLAWDLEAPSACSRAPAP